MAINHSPLTYTQETLFEQAIGGPIAALWQERQEGFVKGTEKKKIYWCKLTNPEHTKAVLIVNGRIEASWKYQDEKSRINTLIRSTHGLAPSALP